MTLSSPDRQELGDTYSCRVCDCHCQLVDVNHLIKISFRSYKKLTQLCFHFGRNIIVTVQTEYLYTHFHDVKFATGFSFLGPVKKLHTCETQLIAPMPPPVQSCCCKPFPLLIFIYSFRVCFFKFIDHSSVNTVYSQFKGDSTGA